MAVYLIFPIPRNTVCVFQSTTTPFTDVPGANFEWSYDQQLTSQSTQSADLFT